MAVPSIDTSQSYLGFRTNEGFAFEPGLYSDSPVTTMVVTGLPSGMALDIPAEIAITSAATVTGLITAPGHAFVDGQQVYFPSLVSGTGFTVNSTFFYYVVSANIGAGTLKVSLTPGGAPVIPSVAYTDGRIKRSAGTRIAGSIDAIGTYVVGFRPINTSSGTAAAAAFFTIGIDPGDAGVVTPGGSDVGIDLTIDVVSKLVSLANDATSEDTPLEAGTVGGLAAAEAGLLPLFHVKQGDVALLNIRFTKSGVILDPDPDTMRFALKELEPDAGLILSTDFEKQGVGVGAYFQMPVAFSGAALESALFNYEGDLGTLFVALAEIEWTQTVSIAGVTTLTSTTRTFLIAVSRDLADN